MSNSNFVIPNDLIERIRSELKALDRQQIANQIWLNHPDELDAPYTVPTGGGCEAYFVDVPCNDENILLVWTNNGGGDLPEQSDWLVSIQMGETIAEEPILTLSSEQISTETNT